MTESVKANSEIRRTNRLFHTQKVSGIHLLFGKFYEIKRNGNFIVAFNDCKQLRPTTQYNHNLYLKTLLNHLPMLKVLL